jgi:hypothetical protein
MIQSVVAISAGFVVADFFVGMYHMLTDKGWNVPEQVKSFREHHEGAVVFDLRPVYAALPMLAIALVYQRPFFAAFVLFAGLSEVLHFAAHRPHAYPSFVRWLQWAGVIVSPEAHAKHHEGDFDRSYCVVSGWTNVLVDSIGAFVPQRATRA